MLKTSRRNFLKSTAVAGAGVILMHNLASGESPNEKINFAAIGVSGKGGSDTADAANSGNLVAICDTDANKRRGALKRYGDLPEFSDFREMFDKMGDKIDAFTCSTPDHMHAPACLMGMRLGKHCFCQKPMTRTIYEARMMAKVAKENKCCTQMGNQGTANKYLRICEALCKIGFLGDLLEAHVWTNRPIWPQGGGRPDPKPVPDFLDWEHWLGVAPERPYADGYHPFSWRGYWDFGTGALGDMACHTFNMPYAACKLADPSSVVATTSGHNYETMPQWSIIEFQFPETADRKAVKAFWYDGGKKMPAEKLEGFATLPNTGSCIFGTKIIMLAGGDYCDQLSLFDAKTKEKVEIPADLEWEQSPGHFQEWVNHIKGGFDSKPGHSNFITYASKLTETILLGNLAVYGAPEKEVKGELVEWDAANLKITNNPKGKDKMELLVKPQYRGNYRLD